MQLEKVLHKIQLQIHELTPSLEIFVEDSIQPTASDCETLQKKLSELQELISVFKYDKLNREISPSFTIHSKINELTPDAKFQTPVTESKIEQTSEIKEIITELIQEAVLQEVKTEEIILPIKIETEKKQASLAPLSIGLNDKFRFINELFSQNNSEYNIALEQLNTLQSWSEAEIYLSSLKTLYTWKEESEDIKHFYTLIKKRYN